MVSKTCKRCGQVARYNDPFHRGVGAISRLDNRTMICSDCGLDEAMEDFFGAGITPMSEWPINRYQEEAEDARRRSQLPGGYSNIEDL